MRGTDGGGAVQLGESEWGDYGSLFGIMLVTFLSVKLFQNKYLKVQVNW